MCWWTAMTIFLASWKTLSSFQWGLISLSCADSLLCSTKKTFCFQDGSGSSKTKLDVKQMGNSAGDCSNGFFLLSPKLENSRITPSWFKIGPWMTVFKQEKKSTPDLAWRWCGCWWGRVVRCYDRPRLGNIFRTARRTRGPPSSASTSWRCAATSDAGCSTARTRFEADWSNTEEQRQQRVASNIWFGSTRLHQLVGDSNCSLYSLLHFEFLI